MDYFIGFLHNKGYVNVDRMEFRIQCQDKGVLEQLNIFLGGNGTVRGDILRTYGEEGVLKALYYKEIELDGLSAGFIRGYFDANGGVYVRGNKYLQVTITADKEMAYALQDALITEGIESIVKPYKNSHQLVISKQTAAIRFRSYIYQIPVCRMEKNYSKLFSV